VGIRAIFGQTTPISGEILMAVQPILEPLTGPAVWVGPDLQDDPSWIMHLDAADIAEIDAALTAAKAAGVSIPFSADKFPLPNFARKIDEIVERVSHGRGFVLVRGIPRERYSEADCELIYWGIGIHIGTPVSQNRRGHLLGHVRDEGKNLGDMEARPYQTASRMDFHCDLLPVDMLGLFCVNPAKSGGQSYIVSALEVHNIIARERPDLLEALYQPYNIDWHGEEPVGGKPWYVMPMISETDGVVSSRITSRRFILSVTRHGEQLAASPKMLEAIEFAQEVANRPELRLSMMLEPGDMQFINNLTTLHARTEFEDFEEEDKKRHLLRFWIALDDAKRRPLSPLLDERYGVVRSGGMPVKDAA
jgi:hypothetical protein